MNPNRITRYLMFLAIVVLAGLAVEKIANSSFPSPPEVGAAGQMGDGLVFVPIYAGDDHTLAPGFSAEGAVSRSDDRIVLDGGATAKFSFTVPSLRTVTVAFGTPVGGYVSTVNTEISVNGVAIATVPGVPNGLGAKSPARLLLWSKSFGPGAYVLSFRSAGWGINFYGLWLSNPAVASPPQRAGSAVTTKEPGDDGPPLAFVPIYAGDNRTLAPGFSARGAVSRSDDRIVLDGGATANYVFTVPAFHTLTVAFGTPVGGYVSTVNTEISVNGVAIATIPGVPNGVGVKSPDRRLFWRKTFEPGSYVLSFRSGGWGINFYGLWLSNPAFANSQQPN
jgi:hypothetical protein